jgi:hypothetical protein
MEKKEKRWGIFFVYVGIQPWIYITNNPKKNEEEEKEKNTIYRHINTSRKKNVNILRKPCMTKLYE